VFGSRVAPDLAPNAIACALDRRCGDGTPLLDLTESNPTRCGLSAGPSALRRALSQLAADPAALLYDPDPCGPAAVRAAIAGYHTRRDGCPLAPEHVVVTAGTSEAYAHLFRLLCEPGDLVHVPRPGYPLVEQLAALEGVATAHYALRKPAHGARWRIDLAAVEASLTRRSRAIVLIHPHNPTGAWVDPADFAPLCELARDRDLALVSDEVFADAADGPGERSALLQGRDAPLCFVLSGASKVLALPQLKVAWIAVAGEATLRDAAVARLEHIADAFLSLSPLAASLLPALLEARAEIAEELRVRVATNRAHLARSVAPHPDIELLPAEAGWAAILRAPRIPPEREEAITITLLEQHAVRVHPGYFFDLTEGAAAHWVIQLLLEPARFAEGASRLAEALANAG
jgi:hypothetical protein